MKKIFVFYSLLLLYAGNAAAQTTLFKGRVTGVSGNVSVQTTTNPGSQVQAIGGNFSIPVAATDTLIIIAPGYQPMRIAIDVSIPQPLVIDMTAAAKALEEVIVNTGYQKIAKERATGSFTTVDNKLLNQQVGTTVLSRLESITNGLYVDRQTSGLGQPRFIIRGLSTINGPASPLIVLDDFPYEGDLNNINPNDVESITVLKDAAAASIWGTRAGNGVIVITTKRGRYNQPMRTEFTSNMSIADKPKLRSISNISSGDFIGVEKFLYDNGYYQAQLTGSPWKAVSPVIELLNLRDQGKISAAEADNRIHALAANNLTDEYMNYVYEKGVNLQQAISLSGGTKNMQWIIGGGWDHNADQLSAKYDRYNFKTAQTFKLTSRLDLNTSIDYTQSRSAAGKRGISFSTNTGSLPVYTRLKDDNGNALPVNIDYLQSYADSAGEGKLLDWSYYPLTDADNIEDVVKEQAILANLALTYKPMKGLSLSAQYQYGRQVTTGSRLAGEGSYEARNYINKFSELDSDGNIQYNLPRGGIFSSSNATLETQNFRGQVNYSRRWAAHEVNVLAGGEWRTRQYNTGSQFTVGYNPDLLGPMPALDYVHPYPNFLTGAGEYLPGGGSFGATVNNYVSFFSNAAYTFRRKYTISASARRDASNLFGATRNNRWTPLWSAGLAWDISNEYFYKLNWLPRLKIRTTYGISGNADPARAAVTTLRLQAPSPFTQQPSSQIVQFENKSLGWERVAMTNLAVDFASRNDRISGSVEYYHKKATNLFGYAQVDYTSVPIDGLTKNVATITGRGVDIDLQTRNITGKVSWSSQLNINFNKDKVKKYYLFDKTSSAFVGGSAQVSAIEGSPVYGLYTYQWGGLDPLNGDPQGYLGGVLSKDYNELAGTGTKLEELHYSGPTLPTSTWSMGNTVSYKRLSVTVRITGKFGHYFQRPSINYSQLYKSRTGHADFANRWQNPGDELYTQVPSMRYPIDEARSYFYANSSILATKADHIRLQYITLQYQLNKVQCYINANNLGLLWKANSFGIDPEYNNTYPAATNIAVGIKAIF
ncbi:SusC/RagA family TonB-linked outer membrane protein [Ferruginibacter sp. HRS2-29]|uniref:SusC/RagA family TonB-linked outer membrane protein n=1 Tax=Ferruginibacter sp. HRS2-29 TaxID=2487334 RepID=UPI0020CC359B|nr:SusC/RagA family TonB-linked outer membrane protein [Ferruginibacter sp. HRS2-29]